MRAIGGPARAVPKTALDGDFDQATAEEDQHQEGTDGGGRRATSQEVAEPAHLRRGRITRSPPTGGNKAEGGVQRDRGHGCAGAGGRSENPERRMCGQEEGRERQNDHQPRDDEADATDESAHTPAETPGAEDRELGRGGPGQQIGRRNTVLELVRAQPVAFLDAELPQQRNVGRRTAEADETDSTPLAHNGGERNTLFDGIGHGRVRWSDGTVSERPVEQKPCCRSEPPVRLGPAGGLRGE